MASLQGTSFVFFSVNVNCPEEEKITELSLISIHENELGRKRNEAPDWFPRIVDKLTLCVDPKAALNYEMGKSYSMTGHQLVSAMKAPFDSDLFNLLRIFLSRQSGKICVVSHGRYGLNVLQGELYRIGKTLDTVDGRVVWFVDSVPVFMRIEPGKDSSLQRIADEHLATGIPPSPTAEERSLCLVKIVLKNLEKFLGFHKAEKVSCIFERMGSVKPQSEHTTQMGKRRKKESASSYSSSFKYEEDFSSQMGKRRKREKEFSGNSSSESAGLSFQSHVYLELETTDLKKRKITELCMVAVHQASLASSKLSSVPRIVDKLNIIIDPETEIGEFAAAMTELNNHIIGKSSKQRFNADTVELIATFLKRQGANPCLIAHNGFKFDFKVLETHIDPIPSDDSLFSKVLCADSLPGLRHLKGQMKQSCKLKDVYERIFPESVTSHHQAEDDTIMLLKIVRANTDLLNYLHDHSKPFFK